MENQTRLIQHNKSGRLYRILGACKLQINGEWKRAVAYVHNDARYPYDDWSQIYVREESEFLAAFTGITWANQVQPWHMAMPFEEYSIPVAEEAGV
ncbi:hypothetical protein DYU11_20055 [Fibrisoma montanum]|uniref:DUF1653 domain-containing protein n=1 Tax=Fibrisoma montanum TaxID=2305895 RepID=A0A418M3E3_9BACT|nr:hypothetical protein [Fibrisoma montanum]RIV20347.1 hypothetical protein DYU11_20055 [Fibrisoma montanum]